VEGEEGRERKRGRKREKKRERKGVDTSERWF